MLVVGNELHHDSVLVVFVAVHRNGENGRDELVESVVVGERGAQLYVVDGNVVAVTTVLGMVPSCDLWTSHLEHVLRVIHIRMRSNPLRDNLLQGVAIHHLALLEHSERVLVALLMHERVSDAHDELVDELVEILPVHRFEQSVDGCLDVALSGVWDSLLEVVGSIKPNVPDDCCVVSCHVLCS